MTTVVKCGIKTALIFFLLVATGKIVYALLGNAHISFQEVLRWVGYSPGVCIALGIISMYMSNADTAYRIGRRAFIYQTPAISNKERQNPSQYTPSTLLSWTVAGLFVCIYSYFFDGITLEVQQALALIFH